MHSIFSEIMLEVSNKKILENTQIYISLLYS
jgi:hypothetical protein